MENYERRTFDRPVEFRAAPEGASSPGTLAGYAAVFNSESRDLGGWSEIIDPAAFGPVGDFDLAGNGVRVMCRGEHLSVQLLGTTDAQPTPTLRISVDEVGVFYECDLPNTGAGRDIAVLAARGDYKHSSFAFRTAPDGAEWFFNENDQIVRRVLRAQLIDVAPVADPAYWEATTGLTSARSFDLDAIRASITPALETETAPLGQRAAVAARALAMQVTAEGSRHK